MTKTKETVAEIVTNRIIEELKKGVVPWKKPWSNGLAVNWKTQKPYSGINTMLLPSGEYATMNQIKEAKGRVRKEELKNSFIVIFVKSLNKKSNEDDEKEDDTEGNEKPRFMRRFYRVWEINTQCTGLKSKRPKSPTLVDPVPACEDIVSNFLNKPDIRTGSQAYYDPINDYICMPPLKSFHKVDDYYHTLFHELIHSTGHKSRLSREGIVTPNKFGSKLYSMEELIAEVGASIMSANANITVDFEQNASYINGWLNALKGDPELILKASSKAQKAVDFVQVNSLNKKQSA